MYTENPAKLYVPKEPRRNPSNRRLNEHGIYIRYCQESNSQPVSSQVGADPTRPQWRIIIIIIIKAKNNNNNNNNKKNNVHWYSNEILFGTRDWRSEGLEERGIGGARDWRSEGLEERGIGGTRDWRSEGLEERTQWMIFWILFINYVYTYNVYIHWDCIQCVMWSSTRTLERLFVQFKD